MSPGKQYTEQNTKWGGWGMNKTWKRDLGAVAVIVGFYAVLFALGVTCPIKFVTGVSCPGCGMTRAWLCLLSGKFALAFHYHPLVWLPPVVVAVYLLRKRLPKWVVNGSLTVAGVLFCGVYLYRMFSGCAPEVVAFAPETGAMVRLVAALLTRN